MPVFTQTLLSALAYATEDTCPETTTITGDPASAPATMTKIMRKIIFFYD